MKIAISGSAGIGKTTLAKSLSEKLDFVFLDEGYELFFDTPGKFVNSSSNELVKFFNQVLDYKQSREEKNNHSVADRCAADLFNLWLAKQLFTLTDETDAFAERCRTACQQYDRIVVLPWNSFNIEQFEKQQNTQKRVMNKWLQFFNHSSITGIISQWIPSEKIILIPEKMIAHEDRVDYILKQFEHVTDKLC